MTLNPNPGDKDQVTRAAGVVGLVTLASRILGALRDILLASFLGVGMVSDAFIAAFRFPNLLRRLFGEGTLSIALIPVFTDCLVHEGNEEARRFAAACFRLLALVLVIFSVVGMALAPYVVRVLAPGFIHWPAKYELTVLLTTIMMPYSVFIGLVALCMGFLNVLGHFAAPAAAPLLLNLAMISAMVFSSIVRPGNSGQAVWLAFGVVIGGGMQLGLQVPVLVRFKLNLFEQWRIWHPRIKEVILLFGPAFFGAAVYQINSIIITLLATMLPQGSVSFLYYADRLVQLPLGVFAIATATAVLPTLSRQAAGNQWVSFRSTFAHALELVLFISLPSMVGLVVLREPIIALLFQHGAFGVRDVQLTADALLYYGIGLWSFAAVRIVLNVYFSIKDTRTPVRIAMVAIVVNLVCGILLMGPMGHAGLALSLTVASVVQLLMLVAVLRRKMGTIGWRPISMSVGRSGICSAVMGVCVWGLSQLFIPSAKTDGIHLLPSVSVIITVGLIVYLVLARLFQAPELNYIINQFREKRAER